MIYSIDLQSMFFESKMLNDGFLRSKLKNEMLMHEFGFDGDYGPRLNLGLISDTAVGVPMVQPSSRQHG